MRRRALVDLAAVSGFALLCLGGLGYLAANMGLPLPLERGTLLKADFADVGGLVPQADVDVSGVRVGAVLGVAADGRGGSLVTMRIDPGVRLRTDVRAYVRPKSLLGEDYVELVRRPGSNAPPAPDGYVIPRAATGQAVEIDQILNTFDPQTRAAVTQSLRELGVAVDGRAQDVNTSIPELDQTVANLRPVVQVTDRRQQDLDRILIDLAVIMRALADEQQALGQVVDSGDQAVGAVAQRDQDLAGTVQQANTLMISLDQILQDLTPTDRASLARAPGTLQSGQALLSQLNPTVDRLLPELLLAQVNYPSNQLEVSYPQALTLAQEWLSAFSQNDSLGHSFRITPIIDLATAVTPPLPAPAPNGGTAGQVAPPPAPSPPPAAVPGQVSSRDAAGEVIPAVVQMLLGLPR
ncbi:MAG TPA: MlaD family protein [Candidatus Dormibacteraeota bacterium]|nr:MlaD family protein [Candidatus Dormibacteraeota bacterium]